MTSLSLHLLINPNAGNGSGKKAEQLVTTALTTKQIPFHVYHTEYPRHAAQLTEDLLRHTLVEWNDKQTGAFPLLVVLGGDGTLHEVINALATHTDIPVGYIPCGSGNDFARAIGLSRKPLEALDHLLSLSTPDEFNTLIYHNHLTDESGYLTNNLGIGIDANIVATANKSQAKKCLNKLKLGSLSYLVAAAKVLIKQKGFDLVIKTSKESEHYRNAYLCTVTNHPYFGGGVALAPNADARKEDMTLVVVERIPLLKLLRLVGQLLRKKHLNSPYVHLYLDKEVQLTCQSQQFGQTDGEELGLTTYDMSFSTQKRLFWL